MMCKVEESGDVKVDYHHNYQSLFYGELTTGDCYKNANDSPVQ